MDKTITYVLEVARCGGIARAARNLYITPSALSKFIIQKEEELGVRLFHREGNKFTLTYPGTRYVEMLEEIRQKNDEMNLEMSRLADIYAGRLRLGFQMSLARLIVKNVIPYMQDEYPSIKILLEEASTSELVRRLQKKQLDLILCSGDLTEEGMRSVQIYESPVVIAAAKGSPLAKLAVNKEGFAYPWISDDALFAENLVLDENARSLRKYAGYIFQDKKRKPKSEVTVTNARTALLCVEQDLGIIVLPEFLVDALAFKDRVELYSYGNTQLYEHLCALSSADSPLDFEISQCIECVRGVMQSINQKVDKQ